MHQENVHFLIFHFIGKSYIVYSEEKLKELNRFFWVFMIGYGIAMGINGIVRHIVLRPRPIMDEWGSLNDDLYLLPNQIWEGHESFFSGHSTTGMALLLPFYFRSDKKIIKYGSLTLGIIHAYTRIYVAAHFPWDCLWGAILGALISYMMYLTFIQKKWHSRESDKTQC